MENKPRKYNFKRLLFSVVAVLIIGMLTFGSSVYAKNTLNTSELVHFFVPFPAGRIVRPVTVFAPDGSKIFTRPITINVAERGFLKRIVNPDIEGLSTHWLTNIDSKPHRIGMKFTNVNVLIDWEVGAAIGWDSSANIFKEAVLPGESIRDLGIDWLFHFPKETQSKSVWYDGALIVFDADTSESLTTIPIKFINGTDNPGRGNSTPASTDLSTKTTYPAQGGNSR